MVAPLCKIVQHGSDQKQIHKLQYHFFLFMIPMVPQHTTVYDDDEDDSDIKKWMMLFSLLLLQDRMIKAKLLEMLI